ncbi:MAG: hypothetical protein GQ550_01360 [Gammaproteobacteria bacterium]|nr:hypothetical protein [Gammaproteobacteria bacterium]
MKLLTMDRALLRRRILRSNIFFGLLVFVVAFGLNISGQYSSLGELQAADTVFNFAAIGGLLYAASFWIFCVMSKPFWFPFTGTLEVDSKD